MSKILDAASLEWQPVRPDVAREVYGKTLLGDDIKLPVHN